MQEMMQGHPDPADDSTPHSLPNGKGDCMSSELSDNMIQNDNQQHGGSTSVDCRFLRTSPTQLGGAPGDNSHQSSEALPIVRQDSDACWDTKVGTQHMSNETEKQSVNVTCQHGSQCGDSSLAGDAVTRDSCVRSEDSQTKTASSCSKGPKIKPAEKQTLGIETIAT